MANESEFPKVDGDILYASEANRFSGAGRGLGLGSFLKIESGTDFQVAGSVVLSAGSLSNPCEIQVKGRLANNKRDSLSLRISGTSANRELVAGSGFSHIVFDYYAVVGSPLLGIGVLRAHEQAMYNLPESNLKVSNNIINHLDCSSDVVLKFGANASADFTVMSYSVQSFRGLM